jgi:hypothetical protein
MGKVQKKIYTVTHHHEKSFGEKSFENINSKARNGNRRRALKLML